MVIAIITTTIIIIIINSLILTNITIKIIRITTVAISIQGFREGATHESPNLERNQASCK
jgi:hypothetical protein